MEHAIIFVEHEGARWLQLDEFDAISALAFRYCRDRGRTQVFMLDAAFVPEENSNLRDHYVVLRGEAFPRLLRYPVSSTRIVHQQFHDISHLSAGITIVELWLVLTTDERRDSQPSVVIEEISEDQPMPDRAQEAADRWEAAERRAREEARIAEANARRAYEEALAAEAAETRAREEAQAAEVAARRARDRARQQEIVNERIRQDDQNRLNARHVVNLRLTLKFLQDEIQRLSIRDRRKWDRKRRNLENQRIGDLRGQSEQVMTLIEDYLAILPPNYMDSLWTASSSLNLSWSRHLFIADVSQGRGCNAVISIIAEEFYNFFYIVFTFFFLNNFIFFLSYARSGRPVQSPIMRLALAGWPERVFRTARFSGLPSCLS